MSDDLGKFMRWITPVGVTIILFICGLMLGKIEKLDTHFTNHLMHHQDLEVGYEKRLATLEARNHDQR